MTAISVRGTDLTQMAPAASAAVQEHVDGEAKPNVVGIYASSIFAMALFFFIGVGVPSAMAYGNAAGWGLGAFCAFWGGPSFGVMASGARIAAWEDKHDAHL